MPTSRWSRTRRPGRRSVRTRSEVQAEERIGLGRIDPRSVVLDPDRDPTIRFGADQDPVLNGERCDLAGAGAKEGELRGECLLGLEGDLVAIMAGSGERDQGREGPLLPRRGPDHVAEEPLVAAPPEPIAARRLLVTPAARELFDSAAHSTIVR